MSYLPDPTQMDYDKIFNWAEKVVTKIKDIVEWRNRKAAEKAREEVQEYDKALDTLNAAILATRKYIVHLEGKGERNEITEDDLTARWNTAADDLWSIDEELSRLCRIKGHSWTDERVWAKASKKDKKKMDIDSIFKQLLELEQRKPRKKRDKNRQKKKRED
jgi:hypothetical protein